MKTDRNNKVRPEHLTNYETNGNSSVMITSLRESPGISVTVEEIGIDD